MSWEAGEAPEGWELCRLGDIATVVGGGTPKTSIPGNFSDADGHPWITPSDLTGFSAKYIRHGRRFLTDQGLATSSAKYMPAGTVLFSTRAPIGYIAIAENPVTTNQGFRSFVPNGKVDSEYLYYVLRFLTPLAEQMASGTTFPELSGGNAAKLPIAYPSLPEQQAIAGALDFTGAKARSAADHLTAARSTIERFRHSVFAAACSGRLTAKWRHEHPDLSAEDLVEDLRSQRLAASKKPIAAIAEADLPEIPHSWQWLSVDSVASTVTDGVHKTPTYVSEGVPFVTVRNLTAGPTISFADCKYITEHDHEAFTARTKPERGDLLISKDGTIGVTRAVRTDREFSIFVSVALVKPLSYAMTDYLELAFQAPQVQKQMVGIGSGLTHLVLRELKRDAVPVPPPEEQVEIVRCVGALMSLASAIEKRIDAATANNDRLSQAVLSRAFRGELCENGNGVGGAEA